MMRIFQAFILLFVTSICWSQTITYSHKKYDPNGKEMFFPIESQKVFISEDKILFIPKSKLEPIGSLLMDASLNKRYEINHTERTIYVLKDDAINKTRIEYIKNQDTTGSVLGIKCFIKTIKRYNEYTNDTTIFRYWLAYSISISNIYKYAKMQGNKNTFILDGSMGYFPLKIEMIESNGEKLITEALNVKTEKIEFEMFDLPEYNLKYKEF